MCHCCVVKLSSKFSSKVIYNVSTISSFFFFQIWEEENHIIFESRSREKKIARKTPAKVWNGFYRHKTNFLLRPSVVGLSMAWGKRSPQAELRVHPFSWLDAPVSNLHGLLASWPSTFDAGKAVSGDTRFNSGARLQGSSPRCTINAPYHIIQINHWDIKIHSEHAYINIL